MDITFLNKSRKKTIKLNNNINNRDVSISKKKKNAKNYLNHTISTINKQNTKVENLNDRLLTNNNLYKTQNNEQKSQDKTKPTLFKMLSKTYDFNENNN